MIASGNWPNANTSIPELLSAAPHVRGVLDRYGLKGCGGSLGPAETLGYFARAHEVALDELLTEVRSQLERPEPKVYQIGGTQPAANVGDTIYRPFFKAGIVVVLSFGALWGAYLLLWIALTGEFAAARLHDVNAHGHAQIFGWVGLFVMGFAYQAFPRFKHTTLAYPWWALATLWMMLVGLTVRSLAQPLAAEFSWAGPVSLAAAAIEVLAIVLFIAIIGRTWQRSGKELAFYDAYIIAALGWFVIQAIYEAQYLAATLGSEGEQLLQLVATWQAPLRDIQIHGFALLMILGVSQRIFHHFYGLPQPSSRLSRWILIVLNIAIVGEVAGLVAMRTLGQRWAALWYVSVLVLTGAVALLVHNWQIFRATDEADRSLKFLRTAYVWLFISLGMLVLLPVHELLVLPVFASASQAVEIGFSHAYYGAIRHAITVGFISLMIVGVASKIVPTLNGLRSAQLSSLWAPFLLINAGCAIRVAGQMLTDFSSWAFPVTGISGLLEVSGLALWGTHLWLVMSGRPRLKTISEARPEVPLADREILATDTIGDVLRDYPELLETFTSHGFTLLNDPQMRSTLASVITIERACRRMDIDMTNFLQRLNEQRQHENCSCCDCCK